MPKEDYWKAVVAEVLKEEPTQALSKHKVCKRAARQAKALHPKAGKEALKKEIADFIDKSLMSGVLALQGHRIIVGPEQPSTAVPQGIKQQTGKSQQSAGDAQPISKRTRTDAGKELAAVPNTVQDNSSVIPPPTGKENNRKRERTEPAPQPEPTAKLSKRRKRAIAGEGDDAEQATTAAEDRPKEADTKSQPTATEGKPNTRARRTKASVAAAVAKDSAKESAAGAKAAKGNKASKTRKVKEGAAADGTMPDIAVEELRWRESYKRKDVKCGRFSEAEKIALKEAAVEVAREKGLSDTDFSWLFQTRRGEQKDVTAGAWKIIATRALPQRNVRSVYACGVRLLHPSHLRGKWTEEETQHLVQLVEAKGRKWKAIGEEIGRVAMACRDRYRELETSSANHKKGTWTEEECEQLQAAVQEHLRTKQELEGKISAATLSADDIAPDRSESPEKEDGRAVLDDIDWKVVAEKVPTRSRTQCMDKWYRRLAPSMVTRGDWGSGDDRRLIKGILQCGATQEYSVPWSSLVPGRTAQQAKRRWRLMVKRVPDSADIEFAEQLDYLVDNFTPDLKNLREQAAPM